MTGLQLGPSNGRRVALALSASRLSADLKVGTTLFAAMNRRDSLN